MGLFDRFKKPKWEHEDSKVRLEAVKSLTDEEILVEIAINDSNMDIREVAVEKVNNELLLAKIAKNIKRPFNSKSSSYEYTSHVNLGANAINRINDSSLLVDIAINAKFNAISKIAVDKINDESILFEIIEKCEFHVRHHIIEKLYPDKSEIRNITDESKLTILANYGGTDCAKFIIDNPNLKNDDLLILIIRSYSHHSIAIEAVKKLDNEESLMYIAENVSYKTSGDSGFEDYKYPVQDAALRRLHEIETHKKLVQEYHLDDKANSNMIVCDSCDKRVSQNAIEIHKKCPHCGAKPFIPQVSNSSEDDN